MFCVKCGKEEETYEGLCKECYLSKRQFVSLPELVDVQVCPQCFAVRVRKSWIDSPTIDKAIEIALDESLKKDHDVEIVNMKTDLIERDPRNYIADVEVSFRVGELSAHRNFKVGIRLKKDTCQRCGKKSGHYYEAIIQLRAFGKEAIDKRLAIAREHVIARIEKMSAESRDIFISKEESKHGGHDFFISSASAAKSISRDLAKMFGAEVKSSNSMAGRKDGQDIVRMTYLVRLPEYNIGDILEIDDDYYLLKHLDGNNLTLVSLENWQESSHSIGRLSRIEVLHRDRTVKEATVVSENPKELQIIDPESMQTVDIIKPTKYDGKRSSISIVRTRKGILLVP